jgi:saccharopine dehydrogenase-like NADP-dependent oxidoreductase
MARPVVKLFNSSANREGGFEVDITVATDSEEQAQELISLATGTTRGKFAKYNFPADNKTVLVELLKDADVVISLLPAPMHVSGDEVFLYEFWCCTYSVVVML